MLQQITLFRAWSGGWVGSITAASLPSVWSVVQWAAPVGRTNAPLRYETQILLVLPTLVGLYRVFQ